jgi:class 3 adenylate cyclase
VSGSTALGEQVDPESVRDLMFRYFREMRAAIERHGGTVEKFVGDAVMAVFGVPVAHEDDALRAVRAAAEMRDALVPLNEEFQRRYGRQIALRIGVNTGEIVAGGEDRQDTFSTGDAVNVAARLEQAAAPGEILVGEQTRRLVVGPATFEPIQPLRLKGKSAPVSAFRLLEVERAPAARRLLKSPFVGRERELALLQAAFRDVCVRRRCRLVTLVGEPGVGKSRLANQLLAGVAAIELHGRCLSYGDAITFWPIGEIVRQAAGIRDEDTAAEARHRIAALAADTFVAERVSQAIGLAPGQAAPEEIAWAIRRLIEKLARDRPVVVLVDDIHWAEPTLLDVLAGFAEGVAAPALILCLARPELLRRRPEWFADVRLEPLNADESTQLVDALAADLDVSLSAGIATIAGGNPLFLEELVAMASESDGEIELPTTLNALLGARLDGLAEPERSSLEGGSVEGEVFHRGAVLELCNRTAVVPALESLTRQELIAPTEARFTGEAAFRFRHILVRDAAYRATSKRRRAELHQLFANWLERKAGDRVAEFEEILGYHLEQAYIYRAELERIDLGGRELGARAARHLAAAGAELTSGATCLRPRTCWRAPSAYSTPLRQRDSICFPTWVRFW